MNIFLRSLFESTMIKVELEFISDTDMYFVIEKA